MIIYNNAGKKKLFSHYGIIIKNIKKDKIKIYYIKMKIAKRSVII